MEDEKRYSDNKQSKGGFMKPSELLKEQAENPARIQPVDPGQTPQIPRYKTKWKVLFAVLLVAVVAVATWILWLHPAPAPETVDAVTAETEKYNENGFSISNAIIRKLPPDSNDKWEMIFSKAEYEEDMNESFPVLKPETIPLSAMNSHDVVLELKYVQKTGQNEQKDIVCVLDGPDHFHASVTAQITLAEANGILRIRVNDSDYEADVWRTGTYKLTVSLNGKTAYADDLQVIDDSGLY